MVFRSTRETETPLITKETQLMASSTLKSHPLHNFPLHDLKWAMNTTNNHRIRKLADPTQKSPQRDTESDSANRKGSPVSEGERNGMPESSLNPKAEKSEKKAKNTDVLVENSENKPAAPESRSKIFIRLRAKNKKADSDAADTGNQTPAAEEGEESVPKTWNLRPRRAVTKAPKGNGGGPKIRGVSAPENKQHASSRPELARSRNAVDAKVPEKKEKKLKFSISLSKEEIEQDIFAMIKSKPARRPKKRARNIQKQLDNVFPGLWLAAITPDSYKVSDTPAKG